jgi:hypothetical protein
MMTAIPQHGRRADYLRTPRPSPASGSASGP